MSSINQFKDILDRIAAGSADNDDIALLQDLVENKPTTISKGGRTVAVGGDIIDSIIITGDDNLIIKASNVTINYDGAMARRIKLAIDALQVPKSPAVGFVKRKDKEGQDLVKLVREELATDTNKMVSLWGAGGVGKTALAIEVARSLGNERRIIWVSAERRANFNFSAFIDEIAVKLNQTSLLKLDLEQKTTAVVALLSSLPSLVILDNFETIPSSQGKLCVDFLVQKFPFPALITTRHVIETAYNILVDVMQHQEARELLDRLIKQSPDSHVFAYVDRESIITAAGSNPLVIQWLVAQISLAQRPKDVLEELTKGEGEASKRVFDRSFKLAQLGADGRATLLSLSLFVPSAARDSLANVAGFRNDGKRINESLKRLASLRLVNTTSGGERVMVQGLTRELTKARFSKSRSAATLRQRFVSYFLNYLSDHSSPTVEDLNAIEIEKDNALSAIDVALSTKDWGSVVGIYGALNHFLDVRGYWDEVINRGTQAIKAAHIVGQKRAAAKFGIKIGWALQNRGKYKKARGVYEESLSTFRHLGDKANTALSLYQIGLIDYEQGDLVSAHKLFDESLTIYKEIRDEPGSATSLRGLGIVAEERGEREEARKFYDESLRIERQVGDPRKLARILHDVALLLHREGNLVKARELYNESLEIVKSLGDSMNIAVALTQAGRVAEDQGDLASARLFITQALEIANDLGYKPLLGILHFNLGVIEYLRGNWQDAKTLYHKSLEIRKSLNERRGIGNSLDALGVLALEQNNYVEANEFLQESLKIQESISNVEGIALAKHHLGLLSLREQQLSTADTFLEQSVDILRTDGWKTHLIECLEDYGTLQVAKGNYSKARESFNEALALAQSIGAKHLIGRVKYAQGILEEKLGRTIVAYNLVKEALNILGGLGFHRAKQVQKTLQRLNRHLDLNSSPQRDVY
jgi:tetratricopeptide (TPR) repeat protein